MMLIFIFVYHFWRDSNKLKKSHVSNSSIWCSEFRKIMQSTAAEIVNTWFVYYLHFGLKHKNTIYGLVPGLRCTQYRGKVECVDFSAMQSTPTDYYSNRQIFASQNVACDAWFRLAVYFQHTLQLVRNERQGLSICLCCAFQFYCCCKWHSTR